MIGAARDELVCPRCGAKGRTLGGCEICAEEGVYVNLMAPLADLSGLELAQYQGGPFGWRESLPVAESTTAVTLGEGDTPLVSVQDGSTPGFLIKNEAANPTWSHKDRAMSVAVTKAREVGAEVVVAPSSGNAGLAAAAYAARAGLRVVIFATPSLPNVYQSLLTKVGAIVIAFEEREARETMVQQATSELGWYPVTFLDARVGGNPYGNSGYKSLAYELARDVGSELGAVVVPTARADLMAGICAGFLELARAGHITRVPRLVAAEVETGAAFSEALTKTSQMEQDRTRIRRQPSPAFSIGSEYAHWQGLWAIRESGGWAVSCTEDQYLEEQDRVAKNLGLVVETASAVAITAARHVADRVEGAVVAVSTSAGVKDPSVVERPLEPPAVVAPTLEAVIGVFQEATSAPRKAVP